MTDKKTSQHYSSDRESPSGYHSDSGVKKQNQTTGMYRVDSEIDLNFDTANQQKNRSGSPYELRSRTKTRDGGFDQTDKSKSRTCLAKREMSPSERFNPRRFSVNDSPLIYLERNREPSNSRTSEFCFRNKDSQTTENETKNKGIVEDVFISYGQS